MQSSSAIDIIKKRLSDWENVKGSSKPEDLADAVFISNLFAQDLRLLLDENEHLVSALEVAERHISGKPDGFMESQQTPVLHKIRQALTLYKESK